jgi:hypothetical protein
MACIVKIGNEFENLSGYNTFITDTDPKSKYFKVTKFPDTLTEGKNLFTMEGTPFLKESTAIKMELVDVDGKTLYIEPGKGTPDYYEGNSVVLSTHVYNDIAVGPGKITILGELKEYEDVDGVKRPIPKEWDGAYNVKWEKEIYINKNEPNQTPVIFYKKPSITIEEVEGGLVQQIIPEVTQSGSVQGRADIPPLGTDVRTWRAGTLYRLEITDGPGFTGSIDENIISVPSLGYSATVKEVLNKNTVLVDKPYVVDNKISEFPPSVYSSTFEFFDGRTSTATIVTGSYQKLVFKNIDTFTGNLDNIKIYRKSRSDVSDYKFLEQVRVEDINAELLVDESQPGNEIEGGAGRLTENTFTNSWVTSSVSISGSSSEIVFDDDLLFESIRIVIPSSSIVTDKVNIETNNTFEVFQGVDYQLNFNTLVSGSINDVIIGPTTVVSESYTETRYYQYDPSVMSIYPVSFTTVTGFNSILIQSGSEDLTRNYIYDNSRATFFDTPQNTTGSVFTSVSSDYTYDANLSTSLTFDTTSGDWGTTSRVQTDANSNANVVSISGSFGGVELILNVWLDSGSYTIPMSGNPKDVSIYSEVYTSGSEELALLSFENIGGDAKFYYYNSSTYLDELSSFRSSTEYELEAIDTGDYQTPQAWHSSGTGSQVIIPYEQSGYNYVHIDYRTNRSVEPLNADLINVQRLDRLNGDLLYGESYDITSMNFNTGEIEFTDGTEADFSGTLNIQNGQLVLTIDGDTQYAYLVEADFNNSVMVFIGRITVGEMEPSSTRYSLYDLFQLSGSTVQNTSTSSFVVPRVPTQGGDNLYTEAGYPLIKATVSSRDFLTPVFDSESSSLDFQSPLDIPYLFRNDDGEVTDVYTFDSSSGQIYNVSSVSSSSDINADSFVYDNVVVQQGFVPSGSIHSDISTVESNNLINEYVNLTTNQHDHLSGSVIISLLTDSGSLSLPTGTGSVEYHIESFVSESGYQSGNTIWRNSMAFRNFNTDGMLFYNYSATSQSAVEAISGSLNYTIIATDTNDFQSLPLNMLESGSQVILDFETSGSGYNYIYLDYRTNRTRQVLNANLEEVGLVSEIDGNPIGTAKDTLALSGSEATTITSASYFTQQIPPTTSSIFYDVVTDYPFFPSTISAGNYIGDKTEPGVTDSILNSPLNIPYVLNISDATPNEVIVQRIDAIYTASSAYGTTGTSETSDPIFISQSLKDPDTIVSKTIDFYLTGSSGSQDFKQYIKSITAENAYSSKQSIESLVTSDFESSNAKLGFEVRGDGWQLAKIDLKPASEPGFSPKIFKTLQEEDRNLEDETFDYKFEMYDVNNNYIPVKLEQTKRFTGGNKVTLGTLKLLTFESDRTAFRFYSGSIANPAFQQIRLVANKQNVTGNITYASAAFDSSGQYIEPSSYSGTYPGGMTSVGENGGIVTIANFSGSDVNYEVGSIMYTASADNLEEYETLFRLEDGQPIADLVVNNNRNVFTYKKSDGTLNPSGQSSTITVKRKNLASNTETITANSSSDSGIAPPLTVLSDNSTTGIATYFLSGSSLDLTTGSVQYEFSASDEFGLQVDNITTITPISFIGGVLLYLTNERGILPAFANGTIPSSSYTFTTGSTKLYVEGEEVSYDNSLAKNTYKIIGVTGSGITPNEVNPTTNEYGGVAGTMTTDSSSLEINVSYKDEVGDTYSLTRTANYNIVREGADGQPGLEGSNGPGLVFTGDYSTTRTYTVTTGSLARKDSVLYNDTFYLAITSSGPDSGGFQHPSSSTDYWEELGTGSNFVAAELAIFKESYVQNNINVGTNNSGSASAANITIAGGTNYPYISIDQGATTGTQGYNVGNGIFLGIDGNTGTGSFSIENGLLGDELLWDGSSLTIRGSIEFSNTPGAVSDTLSSASLFSLRAYNSASLAEATASLAQTSADNTFSSASAYSASQFSYTNTLNNQVNDDLADVISGSTAIQNGSGTTFIDSGIIYSPNIGGANGYFSNAFRVGENGITLDGTNSRIYVGDGNYDNTDTPFYFASGSSNIFSLGDKLSWNGSSLSIVGSITLEAGSDITDGLPGGTISGSGQLPGGIVSGSEQLPNGILSGSGQLPDGIISGSEQLPNGLVSASEFNFGPDVSSADFVLSAQTPSSAGLYIGNTNLGYYDGGWKTYMDDEGNFLLAGTNGSLNWNAGTDTLNIQGTVDATDGEIAGFNFSGTTLTSPSSGIVINTGDSSNNAHIKVGAGAINIENKNDLSEIDSVSTPSITGTIPEANTNDAYFTGTNSTQGTPEYDDVSGITSDTSSTFASNPIRFQTGGSGYNGKTATISGTISAPVLNSGNTKYLESEILGVAASVFIHLINAKIKVVLQKSSNGSTSWSDVKEWSYSLSQTSSGTTADLGSTSQSFSLSATLEDSKYYRIITKITNVDINAYTEPSGTGARIGAYYGAPRITSTPTLTMVGSSDNSITEITKGGLQVVTTDTKLVRIPTSTTGDALSVTGSISATGNITAFATSDERLKENIIEINKPLDKINEIKGVFFNWKEGHEDIHQFKGEDIGVIAQDVEKVVPHITKINSVNGYYGVRYEKLTPLLIEAIKELNKKVDELQEEIKRLK